MNVSPCWKIKAGAEAPKHLDLQRQTHDHRMYFIWLTLIQTRPFKTTKKWEGSDFLTLILPVENLFFKMHEFNIIVTLWGSRHWVASLKKTTQVRSKLFKKPQPYHGTSIRGEGKVGWAAEVIIDTSAALQEETPCISGWGINCCKYTW